MKWDFFINANIVAWYNKIDQKKNIQFLEIIIVFIASSFPVQYIVEVSKLQFLSGISSSNVIQSKNKEQEKVAKNQSENNFSCGWC